MPRSSNASRSAAAVLILVLIAAACGTEPTSGSSALATSSPTRSPEPAAASPSAAATPSAPAESPAQGSPAPSPTAAPPKASGLQVKVPGPHEVYEFGPDVSSSDRAAIQRWAAYGVRFQEVMFGREFKTVTIIASNDLRWVAEKDCESRPPSMPNCVKQQMDIYSGAVMGGCSPYPDQVGCFVVSYLGVEGLDDAWFKAMQYAHEMHHVLFGQVYPDAWRGSMVPSDQVWTTGPVWLLEGAATWVGARASIDQGLTTYAARRAEWEEWSRRIDRPLSQLETLQDEQRAGFSYWYYALALDELIEMAPKGPRSLLVYYEAVAAGASWKSAFEKAFGLSVDKFYAEFEKIRP